MTIRSLAGLVLLVSIAGCSREATEEVTSDTVVPVTTKAAALGAIAPVRVLDRAAEYELQAVQRGTLYSFHVLFVIDTDGVWRLRVF